MINVPNTGTINIGTIEAADFGNLTWFLINKHVYPAIRPTAKAPKNPAPISLAIIPPTRPGTIANLSAIENPINAAITGNINPNAVPPNPSKSCNNLTILLALSAYLASHISGIL